MYSHPPILTTQLQYRPRPPPPPIKRRTIMLYPHHQNPLCRVIITMHWHLHPPPPLSGFSREIFPRLRPNIPPFPRKCKRNTHAAPSGGGGGVLRFGSDGAGCAAEAAKPVPIFKGHFVFLCTLATKRAKISSIYRSTAKLQKWGGMFKVFQLKTIPYV